MFPWDTFWQTLIIPVVLALIITLFAKDKLLTLLITLKLGVGLWWVLWVAHVTVHMLNKYY